MAWQFVSDFSENIVDPSLDPIGEIVVNPRHDNPIGSSLVDQIVSIPWLGFIFRAVVVVATLLAAIIMGVARVYTSDSASIIIKSTAFSQLIYFIAVNVIVCAYAIVSLANKESINSMKNLGLVVALVDLVMVSFLFSGVGSASAIGLSIEVKLWGSKFCGTIAAATVMSMIGCLSMLLLLALTILNLHRKNV